MTFAQADTAIRNWSWASRWRGVANVCWLVVLVGIGSAGLANADGEAPVVGIEIDGIVVDAKGKPVPGAKIQTYPRLPGDATVQAVSDDAGQFRMFLPRLQQLPDSDRAMAAVIKSGFAIGGFDNVTKPIRVVLQPQEKIDVVVFDPMNQPIAGAKVSPAVIHHRTVFFMAPPPESWNDDLAVATDEKGRAKLSRVQRKSLRSVFVETERWGRQQVAVTNQFPIKLAVRPVGELEGQLLNAKKRPLADVSIIASAANDTGVFAVTQTNVEGRFHFRVPIGRYVIVARGTDGHASIVGKANIREDKIAYVQLAKQLDHRVRGVVNSDDGQRAANIPVVFTSGHVTRRVTTSNEDGEFEVRLPSGKWQYKTYADESSGYVRLGDELQSVQITDHDVDLPELKVGVGRIIDGAIVGLDTSQPRIRCVIVELDKTNYWAEYDKEGKFRLTVPKHIKPRQLREFKIRFVDDPITILSTDPLRLSVKPAQ